MRLTCDNFTTELPLTDVLLSLVRTKEVGHIRDKKRLIVALSRARLGLYVFGREKLFRECPDLSHSLANFWERPSQLSLELGERYRDSSSLPVGTSRKLVVSDAPPKKGKSKTIPHETRSIADVVEMGSFVYELIQKEAAAAEDEDLDDEMDVDVEMTEDEEAGQQ